jgi:hypothetical protein
MHISTRPVLKLAAATLFVTTSLASAFAGTSEDAVARFKAIIEEQGVTIQWERADVDNADVVLVDVKLGAESDLVPVGDITLMGITRVDAGYRVEDIVFDDMLFGEDNSAISIEDAALNGVLLPDAGNIDRFGGSVFYESAYVGEIALNVEGKEVASLSEFYTQMTAPTDTEPMKFIGGVEEFYLDLSSVEDTEQKAMLKALDLEEVTGSFVFEGYWEPKDGRFALTRYDTTIDDAGTIGISADIGGYTSDFMASLRDLQSKMGSDNEADNSAQGLAILGLMQQLTFHGMEISFIDDSFTTKILNYVAQSQGMKPAEMANQAKAILPFALAQLENPELTMQATQAISAFIDNPKSLRIKALPTSPVPFALIMAAAMSAPAELTKTLGVAVTAND